MQDGTSPVVAATGLTQGESIRIVYQRGTVSTSYPTRPLVNAAGDQATITGVEIINGVPYPTLFTTASSYPVGQPITFDAAVTDGPQTPVPSVPVTLNVSGANPIQYESTTDSTGTSAFMYTGAYAGTDALLAQAFPTGEPTLTSNSAGITWANYPTPSTPASLSLVLGPVDNGLQIYIALATDASGNPIFNANVGFYVTGIDNFQVSGLTDTTGHLAFGYQHINQGAFSIIAATTMVASGSGLNGEQLSMSHTSIVKCESPLCHQKHGRPGGKSHLRGHFELHLRRGGQPGFHDLPSQQRSDRLLHLQRLQSGDGKMAVERSAVSFA